MSRKKTLDRMIFVPFLLEAITNRIGANANRGYQREFGVGLSEWRVLSALAIEPGSTVMGLSEQSSIDPGAISRVVFSMSKNGLLSHRVDRSDRRRRKLALTKRGRELHDSMLTLALREETKFLKALDDEERRHLVGILQKLYARVGPRSLDGAEPGRDSKQTRRAPALGAAGPRAGPGHAA